MLGPKKREPLFDAEQVRKAEELSAQAPMLQGQKAPSGARVDRSWDGGRSTADPAGSAQGKELVAAGRDPGLTPPGVGVPVVSMPVPPHMFPPHLGPSMVPREIIL